MEFTVINFLIGFFLMNAMPHWIFGITKTRMLSAFGFSPKANIAYSFLNVAFAAALFQFQHGLSQLMGNGIALGALAMLVIYYLTGKFFLNLFQEK
ncbi:MAG: hypothetical protein ACI9EW_001121 [Cellvibrionaceae bacterium]